MKTYIRVLSLSLLIASTWGCGDSVSFKKANDTVPGDTGTPVDPPPGGCEQTNTCPPTPGTTLDGADLFFQTPRDAKVDILVISDNSGSMAEEQAKMGDKFNSFISGLKELDWQIGITTTDMSNGQYATKGKLVDLFNNPGKKILTSQFINPANVFKKTVQRQETIDCQNDLNSCPSGDEQPLYATIESIEKRNNENRGFFRDNSDLAVVILSDEDEKSNGPPNAIKPQDVIDKHKSVWGAEKRLSVYGVVIQPNDAACLQLQRTQSGGTGYYATHAAELARLTGGVTGSICDTDYSATLKKIGDRVHELHDSFELAHVPIAGTVRVTLNPEQPNVRWRVEGNKLIFTPAPAQGTRIDVSYKYKK